MTPTSMLWELGRFVALVVTGATGGLLLGFMILVAGAYMGRSGSTGLEYIGYWNPEFHWFIASRLGLTGGALLFPIGYYVYLKSSPLRQVLLYTSCGTLAGGLVGTLVSPVASMLLAVVGFFLACRWVQSREPA
jgi:hypothetical protein